MQNNSKQTKSTEPKKKKEALAQNLRANLLRRKEQQRNKQQAEVKNEK